MPSTKKSVRFGATTLIEDTPCIPSEPKSSFIRFSWSSSSNTSTWLSAKEMDAQFEIDLYAANMFGQGCLRGLEYHMEMNIDRQVSTRKFVLSVLQQFRDLQRAANVLRMNVHVEEGLQRFAAKNSREKRAHARRMADTDEKEAFRIHHEGVNTRSCCKAGDAWVGKGPICVGKSCHFEVPVPSSKRNSPVAQSA